MREITHAKIVQFHREMVTFNKELKGFYRFNWNEISGNFRNGVATPTLLLESHSAELNTNSNKSTTFNGRSISFLLLDFAGKADDYNKQEEVLDRLENVAIDIASYLKLLNEDRNSWLFGKFDPNTFAYEKVGPIFDNMYGWNVLYVLKNHEDLKIDPDKWEFPVP
ncbi:hypothetical protein GJU43_14875 [Flavobacterium sp. LC2016-23]|uniref:hypothetical protein n=1 Tax=Flavobacterium sp. LC2016-23 TaxID=2666330 RepID=UPI0012B074BC|nr:hypothetical protein [Flavobacterium sp. LC2016-23]MRX40570.1 hypothetical protein [Flavobacterium sp. LC2016-23]